jgi:putative transposase
VKRPYHVCSKGDRRRLAELLAGRGERLLPLLELLEDGRLAVETLMTDLGRASLEALLLVSAEELAGPRARGKRGGEIQWYGRQPGRVQLSDRQLGVEKPRLRRRGRGRGGEVPVPAYEAMQEDPAVADRLLEIAMAGVSTRNYASVLPKMAESVGMSKTSVSRRAKLATEKQLQALSERRFDDIELLVIYIDGVQFGAHHVVVAVGVDEEGRKHLLGLAEGATENKIVAGQLLEDLETRGVGSDRKYLFVIDGSKALRSAIDRVFGGEQAVQRCRGHKVRNVMGYLPRDLRHQVATAMRAAYRLSAKEGKQRLRQQANWLESSHPDAAASLLEGLDEMFTVNELGLSKRLCRCLTNTNIIENPNSAARRRIGRVTRWRDGGMVKRWAATAYLSAEKGWRKIMGCEDLWMLRAALGRDEVQQATGTEG